MVHFHQEGGWNNAFLQSSASRLRWTDATLRPKSCVERPKRLKIRREAKGMDMDLEDEVESRKKLDEQ